jgi:fructokinase
VFVDANLRAPWWSSPLVYDLLWGARWVKLSEAELAALTGRKPGEVPLVLAGEEFRARHGFDLLLVTCGVEGAYLFTPKTALFTRPVEVPFIVDTVGAGDAFSAVFLLGLLEDWPLPLTLRRAADFAAAICQVHGATPQNLDFYTDYLGRWAP